MFYDDDLDVFTSDHGINATVGGVACRGNFDEAFAEFGMIGGSSPSLLVPASISAPQGTAVVVGSRNFIVRQTEFDGTGFQRLRLESA